MNRRTFLAWACGATAWSLARMPLPRPRTAVAAIDRMAAWAPSSQPFLAVEWRYLAGRLTDATQDYGFIVSLTDLRVRGEQELLVQRQDFSGARAFAGKSYAGAMTYESSSGTYTFVADGQTLAIWQLDQASQVYRLTVTTPELTLSNVVLQPQGALISEGGDGVISVGQVLGFQVDSDYYADWVDVVIGQQSKGFARLDMQGLRPAPPLTRAPTQAANDYDHHWFAIAAVLTDTTPAWVSAWRIETPDGPLWDVTIARGSGATWSVSYVTEESGAVAPLEVQPLAWQPLPPGGAQSGTHTGTHWRIRAGMVQPGDLVDLEIAVPPGQFAASARLAIGATTVLEEGVGTLATGTILGQTVSTVRLVVAESSAEFDLQYLPIVRA